MATSSWAAIASTKAKPSGAGVAALAASSAGPGGSALRLLVVDANAIIDGLRLEGIADKAVTIQEVLDEIRDKKSRAFLSSLPYELTIAEPSDESLAAGVCSLGGLVCCMLQD
jgi:RNA-binding protein NOB1